MTDKTQTVFIHYHNSAYPSYPFWMTFRIRATSSEVKIIQNVLELMSDNKVKFGMGNTYDQSLNPEPFVVRCKCEVCGKAREEGRRVVFGCQRDWCREKENGIKPDYIDVGSIADITQFINERRGKADEG